MSVYVVIRDMSAGNDSVGEMWQETKIFNSDTTLDEVMEWAMQGDTATHSRKHIQITMPDNTRGISE